MGCVNPDGTLSGSAMATLQALSEPKGVDEIAVQTGQPLFKVRAGLREMKDSGLVIENDGRYEMTELGKEKVAAGS